MKSPNEKLNDLSIGGGRTSRTSSCGSKRLSRRCALVASPLLLGGLAAFTYSRKRTSIQPYVKRLTTSLNPLLRTSHSEHVLFSVEDTVYRVKLTTREPTSFSRFMTRLL